VAGGKILLVDDHRSVRDMIRMLLESEGYEVVEAGDGREAISVAGQERPDLMVLDLMMPEVNGEKVIQELWGKPEFGRLPVVVVSAKEEALEGCINLLGADNVFSKPFEPTRLLDRIDQLMGRQSPPG
jgi:CheY-like chemotaxis protein